MDISATAIGAGRLPRRMRAWAIRLALALVVGLAFVVGSSEEAQAVSDAERFRFSSGLCIGEKSLTYVWPPNGVLYGQSVTRTYSGDCSTRTSKPAGDVAGRAISYKWSDYYGAWFPCRDTGWFYNADRTSMLVAYRSLGGFYNRACGPGYYTTASRGSVWHNGRWNTTPLVWSGSAFYY